MTEERLQRGRENGGEKGHVIRRKNMMVKCEVRRKINEGEKLSKLSKHK